NLADYASIKNGSYGKLMSAYYGGSSVANDLVSDSSISTASDTNKELSEIQSSADDLKESADKLVETGSKSLFIEEDITTKDENGVSTTTTDYDRDAIYKAVESFVDDYNSLLQKGLESNTTTISGKADSLKGMTTANEKLLSSVGISVGESGRLSIDEKEFKAADMTTVKSLFNGTGSYGYKVSAQASWMDFAASSEAAKSNTYNANGAFSNNYSAGNVFGSYI
ncbi:MAG: hypothetical protein LBV33_08565, partial [Lachnospiraceae bacterium]|nr:hypothetical protein [Lachnospiraceae bacterium]